MSYSASKSGRRYGSTFASMSPGRNPSRSPASTAGRVRMIRPTCRSASAATASAIARYVLPVPAGPIANVTVWPRIASTYCFCITVFGEIFLPRWRQITSSKTSRISSAWSSARTTAPTVSGPISWPPWTSSTSSSTTARASDTRSSSPSIVSTLPRRRIVQRRRSRSASKTPSPTPASSAATSLETGKVSCTEFSVGGPPNALCKRLEPRISRVDDRERFLEPSPPRAAEAGEREPEVALVLFEMVLRLVEKLDLGSDDRNAARGARRQFGERPANRWISAADPRRVLAVVEKELSLGIHRVPGLGRRPRSRCPEQNLVDGKLQELLRLPRCPPRNR